MTLEQGLCLSLMVWKQVMDIIMQYKVDGG